MASTLANSPHRLSSEVTGSKVIVACVSCHEGAAVHVEDPTVDNIGNPAKQSAQSVNVICENCHRAHRELDNIGFDPHIQAGVSCASCHSVHNQQAGLLVDQQTKFCGKCHLAIASQFGRTSTHPVNDGQVTCLSCHDFTGKKQPALGAGAQENCINCHTAQAGPFPWPHEAASSYYPGGEGCIACHNPHGSANDRLLTRPGDGLCTQCHGVPALHRTQHAGIGSQFACIECHADVHGSDHNKGLLDPDLGSKIGGTPASCYCHGAN
jgi:DmsE family decaheme c-type cytochrome